MNKERLIAFTDAVLAIIMTILVLELEKPSELSFEGFWALRYSFLAYMLSFFWIGSSWLTLNGIWEHVKRVSGAVIWWNLIYLFFFSLLPYATWLVSNNFTQRMAQGFYGIIVIATTGCSWVLHKILDRPNSEHGPLLEITREYRIILLPDIIIKAIALILTLTVYPPSMMYGVFFAATYLQIAKATVARRRKKIKAPDM